MLPTMCPLASVLCDTGKKGTHPLPHWYDCCKCLGIGAEQLILYHALLPYFTSFLPRLFKYYMCCLYSVSVRSPQIPTQVLCRQCRSSLASSSLAQCIFWPFEKLTFKKSLFRYFKCTSILHAWCLRRSEEGTRSFGTRVTGCEPSRVFWELNPGLLEELQVPLTILEMSASSLAGSHG